MELRDILIIIATASSPLIAVQVQKWIERSHERKKQKMEVFSTLMSTRALRTSADHVKALNMIDMTFYRVGRLRSKTEQDVLDAWKEYFDNLQLHPEKPEELAVCNSRRDELFVNVLFALSKDVGCSFDKVQLKRGAYWPVAHEQFEADLLVLRRGWAEVVAGNRPLKMEITNLPKPAPPPKQPSIPEQ